MPRTECEHCGQRFDNEYKLFRHGRECTTGDRDSGPEREKEAEQRVEGTVQKFSEKDGYGFIVTADVIDDNSHGTAYTQDVFIHISDADIETLEEGDRLRFDVVENEEGLKAENATRIERGNRGSDHGKRRRERERARNIGFGNDIDETDVQQG